MSSELKIEATGNNDSDAFIQLANARQQITEEFGENISWSKIELYGNFELGFKAVQYYSFMKN